MEAPRLLIVEVDKMMANFLARRFSEVSEVRFDVGITFSGEDALNMVSSSPFDVVLLEAELPGIDGMETLKGIKQVDGDTQAILLAEDPSPESIMRALREGAYDFVQKPFEFEQLFETVRNALERRELLLERRRLISNLSEANEKLARDNQLLLESSNRAEAELKLRRTQIRAFTSYLESSNM
ncbi:MAG: response regulator, partial [Thermoplasmata archaeon]